MKLVSALFFFLTTPYVILAFTREDKVAAVSEFCSLYHRHQNVKKVYDSFTLHPNKPHVLPRIPTHPETFLKLLKHRLGYNRRSAVAVFESVEHITIQETMESFRRNTLELVSLLTQHPQMLPAGHKRHLYLDALVELMSGIHRLFYTDFINLRHPFVKLNDWLKCLEVADFIYNDFLHSVDITFPENSNEEILPENTEPPVHIPPDSNMQLLLHLTFQMYKQYHEIKDTMTNFAHDVRDVVHEKKIKCFENEVEDEDGTLPVVNDDDIEGHAVNQCGTFAHSRILMFMENMGKN